MPTKDLKDTDSLGVVIDRAKELIDQYYASVEELSRNFDILKHSKANKLSELNETEEIIDIIDIILKFKDGHYRYYGNLYSIAYDDEKRIKNMQEYNNVTANTVDEINIMVQKLNDVENRTNKLKQDLPIVRSIQLFIREAAAKLGKLITALENFMMKIDPRPQQTKAHEFVNLSPPTQQIKAHSSMLNHFNKLEKSVEFHNRAKFKRNNRPRHRG